MVQRAAQQGLKKGYDCVVVGAGLGGLASAAQLAAKGAKVLLLEQHSVPGGFATSFVRGRFEFEAALHLCTDMGTPEVKGNVRRFFEDDLGVYLDWVEVPEAFRMISMDPREPLDITMPYGVQEFIDAVVREVPGSREAVTDYVNLCKEVLEGITYIGQSKGNPDRSVLTKRYANFLKTAPYTLEQVAHALKVPDKARKILEAQWVYLGPPPSRLNFTVYAAMFYLFLTTGASAPQQRSHEVATALDGRVRELGGDTEYNTRVEQILVKDARVMGVVTSQGDHIETRQVVSNASRTLVYNNLIAPRSEVPEIGFRECNARVHGLSGFVVYLGLDATLEELGLNDYHYYLFNSMDSDEVYASYGTLDAPHLQALLCMNNVIPNCSPPGTSIVTSTTLYRPEAWANVAPQDYVRVKNKIANDLIADIERATGASIREHIEEWEVATPQTLARYTGSYGGIMYGYEPEPWDSPMPRMMSMKEDKLIDGLDFVGGFAFRSQGFVSSTMSGRTVGLLTWRDMVEKGEIQA